ncbi:MAG: holo-ACP synthase [Desulfatiglans sp.]|jgi:holo-[acyl-carrier protein] synthase|nr:holo-ACP synthase [Desulfatiglans sp.]
MIFGTGVDIVKISRIETVINKWGDKFIDRVFTPDEKAFCLKRIRPYQAFALRFAAKEAFSKALGTGMKMGVFWKDIEVYHLKSGKPCLKVHGISLSICEKEGVTGYHVSLSDEDEYGVAMVTLEK